MLLLPIYFLLCKWYNKNAKTIIITEREETMKKFALLIAVFVLAAVCLVSCNFPTFGTGGSTTDKDDDGNYIYKAESDLYFVYDPAVLTEKQIHEITEFFFAENIYITPKSKDDEPAKHEFIIGDVGRELSNTAYQNLERIDVKNELDVRFCFYSDGSSLALAYDEDYEGYAYKLAVEYLKKNLIKEELKLSKGVVYSDCVDLYTYLEDEDAKAYTEYWKKVSDTVGEGRPELVNALKALYGLYDGEALITWIANLYDPDICVCKGYYGDEVCANTQWCHTGGFYFSNSGRDSFGFLPDVESTTQALNFINSCGVAIGVGGKYKDVISDEMAENIINFAYNLQDPDGYFYHPQWGKAIGPSRRGRDLTWAVSILDNYGKSTRYPTIKDPGVDLTAAPLTEKLGSSYVSAVSKVVLVESETLIPEHLSTPENFKKWLEEELNFGKNGKDGASYSGGSTLSAQKD